MVTKEIYDYLEEHGPSTIRDIMKGLGFAQRKAHNNCRTLVDAKAVSVSKVKVPHTKDINLYSIIAPYPSNLRQAMRDA